MAKHLQHVTADLKPALTLRYQYWGWAIRRLLENPLLDHCRREAKLSVKARLGCGCTKYQEDGYRMIVGRLKRCLVT